MIYISIVAAVLTVAAPAAAVSLRNTFLRRVNPLTLGSFPEQCRITSGCTEVVKMFNTCLIAKCLCTTANGKTLQACFECSWSSGMTGQNLLNMVDDFNNECIVAEVTLSVPTNTYSGPDIIVSAPSNPSTPTTFVAFPTQGPGHITWNVQSISLTTTASATGTTQTSAAGRMTMGMVRVFGAVLVSAMVLS